MTTDDRTTIASASDDAFLQRVATRPETHIEAVPLNALRGWRLLDVLWRGPSHPARWSVAVADDGRVVILSGHPERWAEIDGTRVGSAQEALELATTHADATRDMTRGWQLLTSVDDIRFLPQPDESQQARIDDVRSRLADRLAPTVSGTGPWTVTLWSITGRDLVRHDIEVGPDGSVSDTASAQEESLPVPVAR